MLAWEHILSVLASLLRLCCAFEASPVGDIREDFLEPSVEFVSREEHSGELCELVLRLLCWLLVWLALKVVMFETSWTSLLLFTAQASTCAC